MTDYKLAPQPAQDAEYPACDYCGVIPDHHPWHGSGVHNGEDNPHIHACSNCRHKLPTPDVSALVEALEDAAGYLDSNRLNSIGTGSILHKAMKDALAAHRKLEAGVPSIWQPIETAPVVEQEPVGVIREADQMGVAPYADTWSWLEHGTKLYAAPQPALEPAGTRCARCEQGGEA